MTIFFGRPELLAGFRSGERAALEEVYWAYVGRVEAIARSGLRRGGVIDVDGVADVVQECFVRAFSAEARRAFDESHEYGPYIATIARHALADWWRRAKKLTPLGDGVDLEAVASAADAEGALQGAEAGYADAEVVREVERFLGTLDADLRAAHEQLYVLGRSQRDAALTLGISRQSLRTLDKRLRRELSAALRGKRLRW